METHDGDFSATTDEARAALASADAEEDATRFRPVPVWYFPTIATGVFFLFALNAWENPAEVIRIASAVLAIVIAAGIGWLVWRVSMHHPGYSRIRTPWGITLPVTLVALMIPITALLLDDKLGSWIWIPAGIACATLILGFGIPYQRRHRSA